jgi:acyl-ACP thioesterase
MYKSVSFYLRVTHQFIHINNSFYLRVTHRFIHINNSFYLRVAFICINRRATRK